MKKTRAMGRRPSPATAISLLALVIAMSGTAYAATGGTFILGKANKATSLTSLSNSKGTALALSSAHGKPPLTVSTSAQVAKLNASLLAGHPATAFLPVHGTAANAAELGGQPAGDYMTGAGQVSHTTDNIPYNNTITLNLPNPLSHDYHLQLTCTSSGQAQLTVQATTTNLQVWFSDTTGQGYNILNNNSDVFAAAAGLPDMIMLQVAFLSFVVTTDVSIAVNSTNQTCSYAAQTISDG